MRILVTGETRYLGSVLAPFPLAEHYQIRPALNPAACLARHIIQTGFSTHANGGYVRGTR